MADTKHPRAGRNSNTRPVVYERRFSETMERHVQTILIAIITGSIIFAANYFFSDNSDKAVQKSQLQVLTGQVIELRADIKAMQGTYAKQDSLLQLDNRVRQAEVDIVVLREQMKGTK